ncbi:MAG: aspartyl-tRNA(Asn)/glutamyl-tRNA(Gln) amidotransferase subunit A [Myxococcota bacterium]|jgi:aspartyl-tRNA(Asn)/glutamyl-tRNA(Gln) amidotransferase subunit A
MTSDTTLENAIEIAAAVKRRDVSAQEMAERALDRIDATHESLNGFVYVAREQALADAKRVDESIGRGEDPGPLAGVPFGVKDMDQCAGMPVTYGSLIHKGQPPAQEDSVHIRRLRQAGAIPVGMTSCSEFGTVHFTHTKAWGTTRNPWNLDLTPGGSSGGSGAVVAAGVVPFATAGDGGGSTRIPASFGGLVGMKPSYGRIPREEASTSQTAVWGALTRTVADAARHLDITSGPNDRDRTSLPPSGVHYETAIEHLTTEGLKAVWSPDLGYAKVDPEVLEICETAAGALIREAKLNHLDRQVTLTEPVKAWLGAGAIDIWLHLEKKDWPDRAGELVGHVRRNFEATESLPMPVYANFMRRRHQLELEVAELFEQTDILITPTTAVTAFDATTPRNVTIEGQAIEPAMNVPFTMLANMCWNPAISVPAGVTRAGLPVGLQFTTRRHHDELALRLGRIAEQINPWPLTAPGWY